MDSIPNACDRLSVRTTLKFRTFFARTFDIWIFFVAPGF